MGFVQFLMFSCTFLGTVRRAQVILKTESDATAKEDVGGRSRVHVFTLLQGNTGARKNGVSETHMEITSVVDFSTPFC
jgi:hypothetical protein